MTLEQRIDEIDELDKKLDALQQGTNGDILDLAKKWNAIWDELRKSFQKGNKENQQRIRGMEDQAGLQNTVTGSHNSFGGIHRNVIKLEEKLESHLS